MIKNNTINSTHAEPFKNSFRRLAIGLLALTATAMPFGASATEHASQLDADHSDNLLPLPAIPYLESMQRMRWKPAEPSLKIDTLVVADPGPTWAALADSIRIRAFQSTS